MRQKCSSKDVVARDLTSGYQWDAEVVYEDTLHEAQAAGKGSLSVARQSLEWDGQGWEREMWKMSKWKISKLK